MKLEAVNGSRSHVPFDAEHKLKFKVVNMRPELAQQLLARMHPKQRNAKRTRIDQYAADMTAGRWRLTHQAIGVDEDGLTMDGLNRLSAVVKSGCVVPMVVCYGVPREGMVTTDTGAARNINDAAKVSGINFSNKSYASVARRMKIGLNKRDRAMTIQETLAFVDDYEDGLNFCFQVMGANLKGVTQAGVRAVMARAYYHADKDRLKQFGGEIVSGLPDNSKTDAAVVTLRNWLLSAFEGAASVRRSPIHTYAVTEFALDAYLNKQRIHQLQATAEELYPLPE